MGDTPGEAANSFHVLRALQLLLELLPFSDVAGDAEHHALAFATIDGGIERNDMRVNPALPPVECDDAKLPATRSTGAGRTMHLEIPASIIGMHDVGDVPANHLRRVLRGEHRQAGTIDFKEPSLERYDLHAGRLGVDDRLQPTLTANDDLLGGSARADVERDSDCPGDRTLIIAQG